MNHDKTNSTNHLNKLANTSYLFNKSLTKNSYVNYIDWFTNQFRDYLYYKWLFLNMIVNNSFLYLCFCNVLAIRHILDFMELLYGFSVSIKKIIPHEEPQDRRNYNHNAVKKVFDPIFSAVSTNLPNSRKLSPTSFLCQVYFN